MMTALRACVAVLTAWLFSLLLGNALAADRIAYQGRLGTGPRNIVIMTDKGLYPVHLGSVPGAQEDKMTPALSPDGNTLAFSARVGEHYDIFTWELDKFGNTVGEPKHLTTSDASEEQPAWSRDGKQIAYVSAKPPQYGLYVMNADGSVQRKVADLTRTYRIASPTWSADSSTIAFCKDGELWVVPAEGGEPKRIAEDGWYPSWSPDGKFIAAFVRKPVSALVLYSPDGRLLNTLVKFVEQFGQIAWSSDGKELVFTAASVNDKPGALWTVKLGDPRGAVADPLKHYGQVHGYLSRAPSPGVLVAERPEAAAPQAPPTPAPAVKPTPAAPTRPAARPSPAPAARPTPARKPAKPAPKPTRPAPKPPARVEVVAPQPTLPALPGPEGPVRIISPADGARVRGQPTVVASKDNKDGYVIFEVRGPSALSPDFQWATVSPFQWQWDTRLLPDGEYTLSVVGFDGAGQREGRAEVKVVVENGLPPSALGEQGTLFRLRLNPNQEWHRKITASAAFVGTVPDNLKRFVGTLDANMTQRVEAVTRDGTSATVVTRITDAMLTLGGVRTPLTEGLHSARVTVTPMGRFIPPASAIARHRIGLGELYSTLPQQKVRLGDSWTAPMTYIAELVNRELHEVAAHHKVEELKWQNEMETARIASTVQWPQIPLGDGLQLSNVSIKRNTWFAYKQGKVLRMEDTITARLIGASPTPLVPGAPAVTPRPMSAPPAGSAGLWEQQFQMREIRIRPPAGVPTPPTPPGAVPGPGVSPTTPTTPTAPAVPDLTYTFTLVSELVE